MEGRLLSLDRCRLAPHLTPPFRLPRFQPWGLTFGSRGSFLLVYVNVGTFIESEHCLEAQTRPVSRG